MNKLDTSLWKEFTLDDIFEKIPVEKINGKAGDFPTESNGEYTIPLLTAGTTNHGFARYARKEQCPTILKNVISVSANGDGIAFYQDEEFAVLQDSYAIKPKNGEIPNKEVGVFLETCINKIIKGNYNWSNKSGWNNIKGESIKLPAKEVEVIDWKYMENFIQELERERIQELDAYLKVTGLDDYTLTDEDKETLIKFIGHDGVTKQDVWNLLSGITPPREISGAISKYFKIKDFFEIKKTKSHDSYSLTDGADYDYITRSIRNRGVMSKTGLIDGDSINSSGTFSLELMNCTFFYREREWYAGQFVRVIVPKDDRIKSSWQFWEVLLNNISKNFKSVLVRDIDETFLNSNILLPVTSSGTPDYDLMAKFITAIEKTVIADVVEYKKRILKVTKSLVDVA